MAVVMTLSIIEYPHAISICGKVHLNNVRFFYSRLPNDKLTPHIRRERILLELGDATGFLGTVGTAVRVRNMLAVPKDNVSAIHGDAVASENINLPIKALAFDYHSAQKLGQLYHIAQ